MTLAQYKSNVRLSTMAYMPPEQALGGEVTPKADLYSLGAMLYEMITGRPPFLGDDPVAIIGQHINTPPVAPTWHNGHCPRPLEALILRLLAKDPAERPQSAADVLAALETIDLAEIPPGPPLQRGDGGISEAHALDSLAGGVFVGRQREMGELKAALEDALSGRGRLVTLVGEPGIGKTRTAQELATYAGLRQCQVLWGRCYEGQGAPPYWPWVQAIRSYVRDRDEQQLRSEMGAGAADIAEYPVPPIHRLPGMAQLVARALTLVRPDSHEAGRLLSRYGWVLGIAEGDHAAAQEAFGQALRIARRELDPALESLTFNHSAAVAANHLRWRETLENSRRALAGGGGIPTENPNLGRWAVLALIATGDLAGARQIAQDLLARAEKIPRALAVAFGDLAALSRLEGDWPAARAFSHPGHAAALPDVRVISVQTLVEYEVGDFDTGQTLLERLVEDTSPAASRPTLVNALRASTLAMAARIGGAASLWENARAIAQMVLASPSAVPLVVHMSRTALALLAVQRGDAAAAAEQYPHLEPQRGTMFHHGFISNDRVLGLLAQTMGDVDKAVEHFEDSLAFCRKGGYRPELAWTCCDYADMLLQRDYSGRGAGGRAPQGRASPAPTLAASDHRAKAMALLDESLAISRELGMRPLMERVLSRREILTA